MMPDIRVLDCIFNNKFIKFAYKFFISDNRPMAFLASFISDHDLYVSV